LASIYLHGYPLQQNKHGFELLPGVMPMTMTMVCMMAVLQMHFIDKAGIRTNTSGV
jgi:hypothetical protein